MSEKQETTALIRPSLSSAARMLSRLIIGVVREDYQEKRLIVSHCETEPPKNWMGYPVTWIKVPQA